MLRPSLPCGSVATLGTNLGAIQERLNRLHIAAQRIPGAALSDLSRSELPPAESLAARIGAPRGAAAAAGEGGAPRAGGAAAAGPGGPPAQQRGGGSR